MKKQEDCMPKVAMHECGPWVQGVGGIWEKKPC